MVDLLLNFLSSESDSDCFKEMLNYDRALDHYKYFLWGTIYAIDMSQLPSTVLALPEWEPYCFQSQEIIQV